MKYSSAFFKSKKMVYNREEEGNKRIEIGRMRRRKNRRGGVGENNKSSTKQGRIQDFFQNGRETYEIARKMLNLKMIYGTF